MKKKLPKLSGRTGEEPSSESDVDEEISLDIPTHSRKQIQEEPEENEELEELDEAEPFALLDEEGEEDEDGSDDAF